VTYPRESGGFLLFVCVLHAGERFVQSMLMFGRKNALFSCLGISILSCKYLH